MQKNNKSYAFYLDLLSGISSLPLISVQRFVCTIVHILYHVLYNLTVKLLIVVKYLDFWTLKTPKDVLYENKLESLFFKNHILKITLNLLNGLTKKLFSLFLSFSFLSSYKLLVWKCLAGACHVQKFEQGLCPSFWYYRSSF